MLVAQICVGAAWGCPQPALGHHCPGTSARACPGGLAAPGRREEGVPRQRGCQKERQARPRPGEGVNPIIGRLTDGGCTIPLLSRLNRSGRREGRRWGDLPPPDTHRTAV